MVTMDSLHISRLARDIIRLPIVTPNTLRPRTAQHLRPASSLLSNQRPSRTHQCRNYAVQRPGSTVRDGLANNESKWQQRTDLFPEDRVHEFESYPMVTAEDLKSRTTRPRKVKMLMRDFVDDSLYNPAYGYFSNEAVIFRSEKPFNFPAMEDGIQFHKELGIRYTEFEDALDNQLPEPNPTRQIWHTPTELFRPYYGEAIARYLVSNYRLTTYPYDDLVIYEMGAGNGTLMLNILDYIREIDPDVYARTRYCIIEISPQLAAQQKATLANTGHAEHATIINRSIFEWDTPVSTPCFFLAMEVWDNFAHDAIRYDNETQKPMQSIVLIDSEGDFYEFYTPALDPLAARFMKIRNAATGGAYPRPYSQHKWIRELQSYLPMRGNLSDAEYIPTRLMQFFEILEKYFQRHRLVASDFHHLPDTVKGLNAPVVQTRFERTMVPVTTPMVHQGYFDILFPTDFTVMEAVYRSMTGKFTRVSSHRDFMQRWAYLEETETKSGENPLLDYYKNASVLVTL